MLMVEKRADRREDPDQRQNPLTWQKKGLHGSVPGILAEYPGLNLFSPMARAIFRRLWPRGRNIVMPMAREPCLTFGMKNGAFAPGLRKLFSPASGPQA